MYSSTSIAARVRCRSTHLAAVPVYSVIDARHILINNYIFASSAI